MDFYVLTLGHRFWNSIHHRTHQMCGWAPVSLLHSWSCGVRIEESIWKFWLVFGYWFHIRASSHRFLGSSTSKCRREYRVMSLVAWRVQKTRISRKIPSLWNRNLFVPSKVAHSPLFFLLFFVDFVIVRTKSTEKYSDFFFMSGHFLAESFSFEYKNVPMNLFVQQLLPREKHRIEV